MRLVKALKRNSWGLSSKVGIVNMFTVYGYEWNNQMTAARSQVVAENEARTRILLTLGKDSGFKGLIWVYSTQIIKSPWSDSILKWTRLRLCDRKASSGFGLEFVNIWLLKTIWPVLWQIRQYDQCASWMWNPFLSDTTCLINSSLLAITDEFV